MIREVILPMNAYYPKDLPTKGEPMNGLLTVTPVRSSESSERTSDDVVQAALAILDQGEDLLRQLTPDAYTYRLAAVFGASIGGHYRHCLDHFVSWIRSLEGEELNYDRRDRDPRIETDPSEASRATCEVRSRLGRLSSSDLQRRVRTRCQVSYGSGNAPVTESTLERELVYVIAHAIHHYALISVMAKLQDLALPSTFGVAPSTVRHQGQQGECRSSSSNPAAICRSAS